MKKETIDLNIERVPMLVVWKEDDKLKFKSTANIDNFALMGFLKTYIKFLEADLLKNMAECNDFDKEE